MPDRLELLETFFKEVANLTLNHNTVADYSVIYASDLGDALEKIDREWYKNA